MRRERRRHRSTSRSRRGASAYHVAVPWSEVGIDRTLPIVKRAEAAAKSFDPAISHVEVTWKGVRDVVLIADMAGRVAVDDRPHTSLFVRCTATRDGETQSHHASMSSRRGIDWYTNDAVDRIGRRAAERTLDLFGTRRPPPGEMPVVLAPGNGGVLLHEAIGHGMEADFNRTRVSAYADRIGKKVAPAFATIVDDGTIPGDLGALNVDDEGTPCEKTVLVENGVLAGYLHDRISGAHYGRASSGSGRRESYRHAVMPRMRSTYMVDGPHDPDEIVRSVDKGIYAENFGPGSVRLGQGDFTFYVKNGRLIEHGKLTAPLRDFNIIGNGPTALENILMAGFDTRVCEEAQWCSKNGQWVHVSAGNPTLLVSSLNVGGVRD